MAAQIWPFYAADPRVLAVVVHGSAARGLSDPWSDIELCVFRSAEPTDEERLAVPRQLGGRVAYFYEYDPDNDEWEEEYFLGEIKIEVSHRTIASTDRWISDVIDRYEPSPAKQDVISVFRGGITLYGEELITNWKARTERYPAELAAAMVRTYSDFRPIWWSLMMVERGELLPLYVYLCRGQERALLTLMGLNRIFVPHLGWKWVESLVSGMTIAPSGLAARLKSALSADPAGAVRELHSVQREVFELVEIHMPEVDISEQKAMFYEQRHPVTGADFAWAEEMLDRARGSG